MTQANLIAASDAEILAAIAARLDGRSFALPDGQGHAAAPDQVMVTKSPGPDGLVISTSRGGAFRISLAPNS